MSFISQDLILNAIRNLQFAWLRSKGEAHLSRIDAILRERMERERQ